MTVKRLMNLFFLSCWIVVALCFVTGSGCSSGMKDVKVERHEETRREGNSVIRESRTTTEYTRERKADSSDVYAFRASTFEEIKKELPRKLRNDAKEVAEGRWRKYVGGLQVRLLGDFVIICPEQGDPFEIRSLVVSLIKNEGVQYEKVSDSRGQGFRVAVRSVSTSRYELTQSHKLVMDEVMAGVNLVTHDQMNEWFLEFNKRMDKAIQGFAASYGAIVEQDGELVQKINGW